MARMCRDSSPGCAHEGWGGGGLREEASPNICVLTLQPAVGERVTLLPSRVAFCGLLEKLISIRKRTVCKWEDENDREGEKSTELSSRGGCCSSG